MAEAVVAPATEGDIKRGSMFAGRPSWFGGLVGLVGILVFWVVASLAFSANGAVPTPWSVIAQFGEDGFDFYATNAGITLRGAALGFLIGNGVALAVAAMVLVVPQLESLATQLAVISYCMPLTAIGPIILVIFGGRAPTIFLAAISVFFTTLVGSLLGLKAADQASIDLVSAYGGSRLQALYKVRLIAALPSIIAALQIAAPAAMLGAIIGEYLGGVDNGLGVVLTVAQQNFNIPRTWSLMIVTGGLAGVGYGIFALIGRFLTPWSAGREGGS